MDGQVWEESILTQIERIRQMETVLNEVSGEITQISVAFDRYYETFPKIRNLYALLAWRGLEPEF